MRNQFDIHFGGSFGDAVVSVVDPTNTDPDRCRSILDPGEIARAQAFHFEQDRRAFVAARACLRRAIGAVAGVEPGELRFGVGAWGKPHVAAPKLPLELDFSVAHAREIALVAVARGGRVGIDVERRRDVEDWRPIASRTFGSEWVQRLASLGAHARTDLFLRCWTVAEAYAKATGLGLAGLGGFVPLAPGPDLGDVTIGAGPPPRDGMEWSVRPLTVGSGFVASMILEAERGTDEHVAHCIPGQPPMAWRQAVTAQ